MLYHFSPFQFDLDNATLWQGETQLTLRPKTFDLLAYLVCHAGELVTKDELLEAVWPDTVVSDSALTASMSELRRVLGETAREPQYIATVHRRGYRFVAPVVVEEVVLSASGPQAMGRRLATILSADVQGYSRLIEHDVEATTQIFADYRAIMTTLIEHHHGRVVNTPGDNLLAEFPSVVEAVQSAVAMQRELASRNQSLVPDRQLWFCMGVNLGDVFFNGDDLYGDGVNIAAWLESLAEGGGICISGTVYDQIGSQLDLRYTHLGEERVKNIARTVRVYRVAALSEPLGSPEPFLTPASLAMSRTRELVETVSASPPVELISREAEFAQLRTSFLKALQGQRQVVFITGEAGIGKTTLVDAFVDQVASSESTWIGRGQCIEQYGAGEPYLPLLEALGRLGRGSDGARITSVLHQHAPSWLLQLPSLVSDTEIEVLHCRASGVTRDRMLRELAEAMEALTADQGLVLVLEDLHWSDTATLDWLTYMVRRRDPSRLFVIGTYRPVEAIVQAHSVRLVTDDLYRHGQGTEISLEYFSLADVSVYLRQRFGELTELSDLVDVLHQRTSGSPLFITTFMDHLVHQGVIEQMSDGWVLQGHLSEVAGDIPDSLRRLLEQQLRYLSTEDRQLLEVASVAGAEFAAAAAASALDEDVDAVDDYYQTLARQSPFIRSSGTDVWPDGTLSGQFSFIHDLYREMIYERIPPTRRVQLHHQIGTRLEMSYGDSVAGIAVELATHFIQGRDDARAVKYLVYAGHRALQRHAYQEAISHFSQALDLLPRLPQTFEQAQQELTVLTALGPALVATHGYAAPDVEQAYARAHIVLQSLEAQEISQRFSVLYGLTVYQIVRGDFRVAHERGNELWRLAQLECHTSHLLVADQVMGFITFCRGDLALAHDTLTRAISISTASQHDDLASQYGMDPVVGSLSFAATLQWMRGEIDLARQYSCEAIELARALPHPFSEALALSWAAILHQLQRDVNAAQDYAEAAMTISTELGFLVYLSVSMILKGWAQVQQGQGEAGITQLSQGLSTLRATGAEQGVSWHLGLLAEAYGAVGQFEEALLKIAEALALVEKNEERFYEAELYRLKGELLLLPTDNRPQVQDPNQQNTAEQCFRQALLVSRSQQAKSWELRASMSLSRLWQQQGRQKEARELLAPIYSRFPEGFDTADLQEARMLLRAFAD